MNWWLKYQNTRWADLPEETRRAIIADGRGRDFCLTVCADSEHCMPYLSTHPYKGPTDNCGPWRRTPFYPEKKQRNLNQEVNLLYAHVAYLHSELERMKQPTVRGVEL